MSYCSDLKPILRIIKAVIFLIQFIVPIGLILFGTLDLGKAVISSKEEEMKKAQSMLIKRVIYAVAIFLVVFIVTLVMNIVADNAEETNATDWKSCWNKL
ncbi:MAG: hypothetical protein VZS44_06095 [Bacilli bacterium]|nr:hypothetical protein [Bacilli bacterium]